MLINNLNKITFGELVKMLVYQWDQKDVGKSNSIHFLNISFI